MQRIEMIGPPGVGKSTLLAALESTLKRQGVPVDTARWMPYRTHADGRRSSRLEEWLYGRKGMQRWMRHKFEKEMVRGELKRLREAVSPWPEFLDHALRGFVVANENPALRLERLQSFVRQVATAHAADRLPGDVPVLFDEGLAQRGVSLGQGSADSEVEAYFCRLPLPALTVHVLARSEIIHQRLRARNPEVERFHAMVERAREVGNRGCGSIEKRGGEVMVVDSERETVAVAAELANHIREITTP